MKLLRQIQQVDPFGLFLFVIADADAASFSRKRRLWAYCGRH